MAARINTTGPAHPLLAQLGSWLTLPLARAFFASHGLHAPRSGFTQGRALAFREKLARGQPAYLLGILVGSHNSGAALVEVTRETGARLLCNNEEERYAGIKHYSGYPQGAVQDLQRQMEARGLGSADIDACLIGFDHALFVASGVREVLGEAPHSLTLLRHEAYPEIEREHFKHLLDAPRRLGLQLDLPGKLPIIGVSHHASHAYFSYAVSPFARSDEPVMISVIDGNGDDGSISLYLAQAGRLERVYTNASLSDSLGFMYRMLSSTQGGWTPMSSEGRYMGATAWGDNDRLTNPHYRRLRQLLHFEGNGEVRINRTLANWHRQRFVRPYTKALEAILGPPIPYRELWNPDAVLRLHAGSPAEIDQDRFDRAAAVQMLFEDALFHVIGHFVGSTGSSRLILTGGTALNCVANMRLLDHLDEGYYERRFRMRGRRLEIWVPPTPSDAGIPPGAAYCFALGNGAAAGPSLEHAFYCGSPYSSSQVQQALRGERQVGFEALGSLTSQSARERVADLLAGIVSHDGVVGLLQGVAETGPRALGHRSILANPCNPNTPELINQKVKFREPFRPLAPMLTLEAARQLFELSPGAAAEGYNAYNYMVLTARARPLAKQLIPAVIHRDGTSRLQIVRRETDPFCHAYLKAMGRRLGVEVSVNTSLNVGSPIAQSPSQALAALQRSKGMDGLLLIGEGGEAFLAWHDLHEGGKESGAWTRGQLRDWQSATVR